MNLIKQIIDKFNDGGPFFSYTIFIVLIIIIALFISAFLSKDNYKKVISLMSHFGWFAVAMGFLARSFGLIKAFDNLYEYEELTLKLLADGFKMALLGPLFGILVFIIARIGIIILAWISKEENISK